MERLTKKHERGYYMTIGPTERGNYDAIQRLGELEDAEEQGMLIRLPCKVGDPIVCVGEYEDGYDYSTYLFMATCGDFVIVTPKLFGCDDFKEQLHDMCEESQEWNQADACMFHRNRVFLTKEEAEVALAEMNKKENINE